MSICSSTCILTPCNGFKWQQRARRELESADSLGPRHPEYRYSTEFQSHEPEVMFHFLLDVGSRGFWRLFLAQEHCNLVSHVLERDIVHHCVQH